MISRCLQCHPVPLLCAGGSGSVLTGRRDGYPSIIRACYSAPHLMGVYWHDIY